MGQDSLHLISDRLDSISFLDVSIRPFFLLLSFLPGAAIESKTMLVAPAMIALGDNESLNIQINYSALKLVAFYGVTIGKIIASFNGWVLFPTLECTLR